MSAGSHITAPPRGLREIAVSWTDWIALGAVAVIVAVVPLVVDPRWYDRYYWPKVEVFYVATALGAVALLWRGRADWLGRLRLPVGYALLAWLAALTVATIVSVDPATSLVGEDYRYEGLVTWLAYGVAAAVTAAALITAARVRAVIAVALGGGAVMSILALLQYWGARPVPLDFERAGSLRVFGTVGNPIALGAYLVLLLPIATSLFAAEARPEPRRLWGAVVVLLYAALIASLARGAWAALPVGIAAWAAALGPRALRAAARPLAVLMLCCAAVTPVILLTGPVSGQLDPAAVANSLHGRMFLWETSGTLVRQRPLFGWGPETLAQIYPAYGTPKFFAVYPYARMMNLIVDRPHNDLLQQAIAAGVVGLAAYVWLWAALLRTAWVAARAGTGAWTSALSAGLLGGLAAYLVQLQLAFSYVSVAPVLWVLIGVLLALDRGRFGAGVAE